MPPARIDGMSAFNSGYSGHQPDDWQLLPDVSFHHVSANLASTPKRQIYVIAFILTVRRFAKGGVHIHRIHWLELESVPMTGIPAEIFHVRAVG
jgi:hypothetical protein